MWHPAIYCAGRLSNCKNCNSDWRLAIKGFSDFDTMIGIDTETPVTTGTIVRFRAFDYVGPFTIDTASGHATGHADNLCGDNRRRVWEIDNHQIRRADLFVAYVEDLQAFGSLVEIGIASALRKPIALGLGDELSGEDLDELWFARAAASKVYRGSPARFWQQVCADWIEPVGRSA